MKQFMKTLVAGFLTVAMVFTLTPMVGGVAFANDRNGESAPVELGKIVFDGEVDDGWAHFYPVSSREAALTVENLNITVLDKNGGTVDPEAYDLEFRLDDAQKQDPFGIADQSDEGGFTEYEVVARAKEGSGYVNEAGGSFFVMDEHSLNWICAKKTFNDFIHNDGWRQAERYWVSLDGLGEGTSVTTVTGVDLTDDDYTVTYYERAVEPTDDPSVDRWDVLTPDPDKKLNGLPTEPGGYLAVFAAKENNRGGYYGGDVVLLDVGDFSRMWFQGPPEFDNEDDVVYNDGTFTYQLKTVGIPDNAEITYTACRGNGEELPAGAVAIDENRQEVTIDGSKLDGIRFVKLRAEARVEGNVICRTYYNEDDDNDWTFCRVAEARTDYRIGDRDMLPGWDGRIDGHNNMRVENTAHPFGEDIDYEVTGVEITDGAELLDDDCLDQSRSCLKKEVNEDDANDFWYEYRVKDSRDLEGQELGDVNFRISYKTENNTTGSFEFTAHIKWDVYGVDLSTEGNVEKVLPGQSITLFARGWCESTAGGRIEEGFDYEWSFDWGDDVAELSQDPDDPAKATVTFKDKPGDQEDYYKEDVQVRVKLFDDGAQVASRDRYLETEESFCQITPTQLDGSLDVDGSLAVTPKVLWWSIINDEPHSEEVDDVTFRWENYNDEVLNITGPDENGQYTITRNKEWETDLQLIAEWEENGEDRRTDIWYWFDNKDYNIWIESDRGKVYSDGNLELTVRSAENPADYDVAVTVGVWDDSLGEDGGWSTTFEDTEYTLAGNKITLKGAALFAAGGDGDYRIRVLAQLKQKDGDTVFGDGDYWIDVKEAREEYRFDYNRNLLPGWPEKIDKTSKVYIENSDHPDGDEPVFDITGVALGNNVNDQDEEVLELYGDANSGWEYRALNYGTATLNITYLKLDGSEGQYSFDVHVSDTVYGVDLDVADGGSKKSLPDGEIKLAATGWKDVEGSGRTTEGLTYKWSLDDWASSFATVTADPQDGSKATVTFHDIGGGDEWFWHDFNVKVEVCDGGDAKAAQEIGLSVSNEFYEIWPIVIESPDPGKSVDVTPKLRCYSSKTGDYQVEDNVTFEWSYDNNAVKVTENEDGSFTLTRLRSWDTDINLKARWKGGGQTDAWYRFDNDGYDMAFAKDEYDVSGDCQTEVVLDTSKLGEWDYSLRFEVVHMDDNDQWVPAPDNIYAIDNGNNTVTIYGDQLERSGLGGVNVHAELYYGEDYVTDAWCWVGRNDSLTHNWGAASYEWADDFSTCTAKVRCTDDPTHIVTEDGAVTSEVKTAATCESKGTTTYTAAFRNNLFETQTKDIEDIPAKGHKWGAPAYKWATNGKSCTAEAVCERDAAHKVTEKGLITSAVKTKATYTAKGTTTYTATFKNGLFTKQTKNVQDIAKLPKVANPMKIKAVTKTVKVKKLKKKAQSVTGAVKFTKKAQGTVTYTGVGVNAKSKKALKINKKGTITVKKKTKKGTYKMKVTVKAAGTAKYKALTKTVTVTIKVQ